MPFLRSKQQHRTKPKFQSTKLVNNPTNKYIVSCAILGIAYIVIFNTIGYYAFKKAEIK